MNDPNELHPATTRDGWTTATSANYHMPDTLFVVKVEQGTVTEIFGAGKPEEAKLVSAILRMSDAGPRNPTAGALIVKGLKTTLELAERQLAGNATLAALYEYDMTIVKALITRYEKYTSAEEPAKVPDSLS